MNDLIDAAVVARPRLENAPLKTVICQVRFQQLVGLKDEEIRPVQKSLTERYPRVEKQIAQELTLSAVPRPDAFFQQTGSVSNIYRFQDREKHWTVTIGPEAISLETTEYLGMKDFLTRWAEIVTISQEALGISLQERLGLRYVNELTCPGRGLREDLQGWVNGNLIGLVGAHEDRTSEVVRSFAEGRFRQPDGCICTIRHGVAEDPEEPTVRNFLLDFDYYSEEEQDFDPESQVKALGAYNDAINELFEWAFPSRTRDTFGPEIEPGEGR